MKIYFSVDNFLTASNPYARTLADGLKKIDDTIESGCGLKNFWNDDIFTYDIVHIHWPDLLLVPPGRKRTTDELKERLVEIKRKHIKIVSTCHNLVPHTNHNDERMGAYDTVYSNSDTIIHLGSYSLQILLEKYPHIRQIVIPHHVYDQLYTSIPSKEEALKFLGLKSNYKYLLCFGKFRSEEERQLVIDVNNRLKSQGFKMLVPGFSPVDLRRKNPIVLFKSHMQFLLNTIKYPSIIKSYRFVPDSKVPFYFAAADVCLIPRKHILNSGNLPLSMLMKNVVVGPNMGNVGLLLNETGNPSFNPESIESVIDAVSRAIVLGEEQGEKNYQWVQKNLLTSYICDQLLDLYKSL